MRKDTINLADGIKIFKKNLKTFYFSITAGVIIGLIGIFLNINYIEKKIILSSKITIKNPLENYLLLDLFSLDRIQVDEKRVSITSTQDKIRNYYAITKEYFELVLNTIDFKNYDIDSEKYGYKINTEKKETEFNLTISNTSNPKKVEQNLRLMINDFNKLIRPIILKNILIENSFIEKFLEMSQENPNSERLSILIKIRKETLNSFKGQNFEIFDLSSDTNTQEIANSRIIIVSLLISLSLFLMFIIIKK